MVRKVLMPTDGSDYALQAAEYAADLAAKYGAEVMLLNVVEVPLALGPIVREERPELRRELTERGREALDRTRGVFEKAGINPGEEIVYGSAVSSINRYAREGGYDLMVIGSRGAGTSAIEQILLGSVAEGILHDAPCPVLLVRPRKEPTSEPG